MEQWTTGGQNPDAFDRPDERLKGPLRRLVEAAALAPSSHNTQPWRFRIGDGGIEVLADRSTGLCRSSIPITGRS
jgi:hypothetical protein